MFLNIYLHHICQNRLLIKALTKSMAVKYNPPLVSCITVSTELKCKIYFLQQKTHAELSFDFIKETSVQTLKLFAGQTLLRKGAGRFSGAQNHRM